MGQRILQISGSLFPKFFAGEHHYRVIKDHLPDDTRILDVATVFRFRDQRDFKFTLESDEWEGPLEGQLIPSIEPVVQILYPKEGDFKSWVPD